MGNYNSTKAEIKNYICARTPLIVVDSSERERVERILKEIATELNISISYYTDAKHPSYAGAFLSACVHAATVLGINPCDSAFAGELDEQTASVLKQIALSAVAG